MSAEVLREAARLMRNRADHATEGPWEAQSFPDGTTFVERVGLDDDDAGREVGCLNRPLDAEHVASWHPDVAIAVADWLDRIEAKERARERAGVSIPVNDLDAALAIARAYLGEPA